MGSFDKGIELLENFSEDATKQRSQLQVNIYAKTNRYDKDQNLFEKGKSLLPK